MPTHMQTRHRLLTLFPALLALAPPARAERAADVVVTVHAARPVSTLDRRRLLGTNLALWNEAKLFTDPDILRWFQDIGHTLIRIPGGSWSDITFWNGNGMRRPDGTVDHARVDAEGYPLIDYSAYAPQVTTDNDGKLRAGKNTIVLATSHDRISELMLGGILKPAMLYVTAAPARPGRPEPPV